MSSVYPSGVAFATWSAPTVPPAPARFSTTTGCPSASCSPGATSRAEIGGRRRDRAHGREILERAVRVLRIEARRHAEGAVRADEQRVPVRRGFRYLVRADRAAGAGAILHHDRLPERVLQPRGHEPR